MPACFVSARLLLQLAPAYAGVLSAAAASTSSPSRVETIGQAYVARALCNFGKRGLDVLLFGHEKQPLWPTRDLRNGCAALACRSTRQCLSENRSRKTGYHRKQEQVPQWRSEAQPQRSRVSYRILQWD